MTHRSGMKFKGDTKLIDVPNSKELYGFNKAFIGFCGGATDWAHALHWLHKPEGKPSRFRDVEFVMLTSRKTIFHSVDLCYWTPITEKLFAIGSGAQFAIGAMASGQTPEEAIKTASKYDPYTGLGCKTLSL